MKRPEISVVIPTYDRLSFLKEALGSVWAQTFTDYEVVVVDDGSTDGTREFLHECGDRVRFIWQRNKGPGAARNAGVRQARGNYVAFLDSDDLWFPWTLATFDEVIRQHRDVSLISAATMEFQGELSKVPRSDFVVEAFDDFFKSAINPAYVGSGAMVVKRNIFAGTGGFDESLSVGEDLDFYLRVGTTSGFVRVLSPVTLAYRRHSGNVSTTAQSLYCAAIEILKREKGGRYPGGKVRRKDRWTLLTRMVRPVALSCLKSGLPGEGWQLYWRSFLMNAWLGRSRFLAGFVYYGVLALVRGHPRSIDSDRVSAESAHKLP